MLMTTATQRRLFGFSAAGAVAFVVLTAAAMVAYPGGTPARPTLVSYSFFENFFSDLGQTRTPSGRSNAVSLTLFALAMTSAGTALVQSVGQKLIVYAALLTVFGQSLLMRRHLSR